MSQNWMLKLKNFIKGKQIDSRNRNTFQEFNEKSLTLTETDFSSINHSLEPKFYGDLV